MKYFINFVPEYNTNYYTFTKDSNYILQASYSAMAIGYKSVLVVQKGMEYLIEDPNFSNEFIAIECNNVLSLLKLIRKYNSVNNIFYVNSVSLYSFMLGIMTKRSIFISHGQNDKRGVIRQIVYNALISFFSKIRINSIGDYNFLRKFRILSAESKLFYLPLAIDASQFGKTNNSTSRRDIVILGSMRPCKGVGTMLQAFSLVKEKYPDTMLHIVGYIDDIQYSEYVKKYNLSDNIVEHGFLSAGVHMNTIINNCCIYLNSSTTEGQCLAAYESALSGCALCVPRIPAFNDNLKDFALFHNVGDYEQLAKNIIYWLEHPEEREEVNNKCIEMIKANYTAEAIAPKMKELLTF